MRELTRAISFEGSEGGPVRGLILALDRALGTIPHSRQELELRRAVVRTTIKALEDHGVDGESLLRYGMAHRAAFPLVIALLGSTAGAIPRLDDWKAALRIPANHAFRDDADAARDAVTASIRHVDAWIVQSPLDEVLRFAAPTHDHLSALGAAPPPRKEIVAPYLWLWERSVEGDLSRWPTEVLHLEYQWRNDLGRTAFSEAVLEYEGPSLVMLNEEIAYRAVCGEKSISNEAEALFWALQDTAVDFLGKRRYEEAAALFEFHWRQYPDDARAINNLGFCKVPSDPAEALRLLQRADAAGFEHKLINVYNQCCCFVALNRSGEALDRAESFWQRERDADGIKSGYIWQETKRGWILSSHNAIEVALAELAVAIAVELGRDDRAARWSERASSAALVVSGTPPT